MKCNCWVHKSCSGIRKCLTKVVDFAFRKYYFTGNLEVDYKVTIISDVIEKAAKLLYLENVFSSEKGVEEAVTAEI